MYADGNGLTRSYFSPGKNASNASFSVYAENASMLHSAKVSTGFNKLPAPASMIAALDNSEEIKFLRVIIIGYLAVFFSF